MPVDVSSYALPARPNALEQMTTGINAAQGIQNYQKTQVEFVQEKLGYLRNQLASLVTKPNLSMSDFQDLATNGIKEGVWSGKEAALELANIKDTSPEGLRNAALQFQSSIMTAQERIAMQYGTPTMVNSGGQTNMLSVSPVTGVHPIGAPIANTLSPSEQTEPMPIGVDPATGRPIMGTKNQFLNRADPSSANRLIGAAGAPAGPAAPVGPAVDPFAGQPQVPGADIGKPDFIAPGLGVVPSQTGATPEAPAVPKDATDVAPEMPAQIADNGAQPGGGIVTTARPGQVEAAAKLAETGAQQASDLQVAAAKIPEQRAILGQMESLVKDFKGGPGTDEWKSFEVFVNSVNPFGEVFDPTKIRSKEEFDKLSTQLAQAQFQALGGTGTDSQLDSTMHTSPNSFLSNYGNTGIIHVLQGNLDALEAKNEAWQAALRDPEGWNGKHFAADQYADFTREFQKHFDPRIFQMAYMTPDERAKMIGDLSKSQRADFTQNLRFAIKQGWFSMPGTSDAPVEGPH